MRDTTFLASTAFTEDVDLGDSCSVRIVNGRPGPLRYQGEGGQWPRTRQAAIDGALATLKADGLRAGIRSPQFRQRFNELVRAARNVATYSANQSAAVDAIRDAMDQDRAWQADKQDARAAVIAEREAAAQVAA